jgi:hypothetical protein
MGSRLVADPLRLYHCCPISDGAAALVLTAESAPVRIAGIGQGSDTMAVRYRNELTSFRATQAAAQAAYAMAGFGPERIEVAEIHDAFSSFELISLEDTGLVPAGKAGRATLDGETALDGRLPGTRRRAKALAPAGRYRHRADRRFACSPRNAEGRRSARVALAHNRRLATINRDAPRRGRDRPGHRGRAPAARIVARRATAPTIRWRWSRRPCPGWRDRVLNTPTRRLRGQGAPAYRADRA